MEVPCNYLLELSAIDAIPREICFILTTRSTVLCQITNSPPLAGQDGGCLISTEKSEREKINASFNDNASEKESVVAAIFPKYVWLERDSMVNRISPVSSFGYSPSTHARWLKLKVSLVTLRWRNGRRTLENHRYILLHLRRMVSALTRSFFLDNYNI